jgi:plastocyanin
MNPSRLPPAVLAIVVLGPVAAASAATHVITQQGFTFSPSTVTVAPGDTIQWVRTAGSHTVTSGSPCQASGLFNAPLNSTNTSFTWVVPNKLANSTVGFFCSPHCSFGMTGSIVVGPIPNPADLNGDGIVNGADLTMLLGNWGGTGTGDLDGNGVVGAGDLAVLLAAWTG